MVSRRSRLKGNMRGKRRTICEVHRQLYRSLMKGGVKDNSKIVSLLQEAFVLGKKMNVKLR